MKTRRPRHALALAAAALLLAAAPPAWASGSVSSAASEGVSASVGSLSTSIEGSSDSSSRERRVAAGDYEVLEVAAAPARPGLMRVKLEPVDAKAAAAGGAFNLYLPAEAAARGGLAPGRIVTARERPYGIEFVARDAGSFYLVLTDDWHRDLQTRVLTL